MSELVSMAMENKPPLFQRVLMAVHTLMCRHCAEGGQQLKTIRKAGRCFDDYCSLVDAEGELSASAADRIKCALREHR